MNDLQVYIGNNALNLNEGTSINMVFNNSLLDTEVLQGSYSYSFSVPASPRNKRILGFVDLIENQNALEKGLAGSIRYASLNFSGMFKVRASSPNAFNLSFLTDIGQVADKMKSMKLPEITAETVRHEMTGRTIQVVLNERLDKKWPEVNFVFLSYKNTGSVDVDATPFVVPPNAYINYYNGGYSFSIFTGIHRIFCPQICLGHVLESVFKTLNLDFSNLIFEDSPEKFDRIVLYSNKVHYSNLVGHEDTLQFFFGIPGDFHAADFLPNISISEFLVALKNFLFVSFSYHIGKQSFEMVRLKDLINNESFKDWSEKALPDFTISQEVTDGVVLDYSHDGDDAAFKESIKDISTYKIMSPVANYAALPHGVEYKGNLKLVLDENSYYLARKDYGLTVWDFFSKNIQPLKIGGGKASRKAAASFVNNDYDERNGILGNGWDIPHVSQPVNAPEVGAPGPFSLRFLFNWGMQPMYGGGATYPHGSADPKNVNGGVLGPLALRYDGANGIYEQLGKEWIDFLENTKKVNRKVWLRSIDVANMSHSDTIRIDGVDYLWKSCKISFPISKPAEFELWKK